MGFNGIQFIIMHHYIHSVITVALKTEKDRKGLLKRTPKIDEMDEKDCRKGRKGLPKRTKI